MIYIRGYFGNWYEVNKDKAIQYAKKLCPHMTGVKIDERLNVFNEKHCKGYVVTQEDMLR